MKNMYPNSVQVLCQQRFFQMKNKKMKSMRESEVAFNIYEAVRVRVKVGDFEKTIVRQLVTSNWHWKSSPSSDRERDQLNALSNILSRVQVNEEKDKWWWGECNDPSPFLVANARKLIEVKMFDIDQFKFLWNRWAPLKINAFVWRASLNRTPTRDALRHMGIMVDPNCPFCSSFTESAGHILIWCGTTVELWNKVMTWCKNSNFNFSSIHDLVLSPEKWAGDKCYKKIMGVVILSAI
ncbi:hypothetical protein E3N88_16491 [Mikania micrantha]|uniref:Reverse transcriptase zinc-binding domain-containing protein n=1 Tax=Mikania micrantha TaxID=192012 RepID=A0A5N6P083_9ASTR|nr:hypothetical protein E3N88_16491 [Mikania micrantha]